jgi:hypothetical protein
MGPGAITLAVIPLRPFSRAIDLVNAMTPPLAAAYTEPPREPSRPASDAMLIILPNPADCIGGSTACVVANTASRFTASRCRHCSTVVSVKKSC